MADGLKTQQKVKCRDCDKTVTFTSTADEAVAATEVRYGWKLGRCRDCQKKSDRVLFGAIGRL